MAAWAWTSRGRVGFGWAGLGRACKDGATGFGPQVMQRRYFTTLGTHTYTQNVVSARSATYLLPIVKKVAHCLARHSWRRCGRGLSAQKLCGTTYQPKTLVIVPSYTALHFIHKELHIELAPVHTAVNCPPYPRSQLAGTVGVLDFVHFMHI